jgi:hypothetical protein
MFFPFTPADRRTLSIRPPERPIRRSHVYSAGAMFILTLVNRDRKGRSMHHEHEPAFETFMNNIESSLQVVRETEALLETMHERKTGGAGGSSRSESRNTSA